MPDLYSSGSQSAPTHLLSLYIINEDCSNKQPQLPVMGTVTVVYGGKNTDFGARSLSELAVPSLVQWAEYDNDHRVL